MDPIPQFDIYLYSAYGSTGVGAWYGGVDVLLEVLDSVRDVKGIEAAFVEAGAPSTVFDPVASSNLSPPVRFMDVIPLALLGVHMFYGTGHQSTIPSLQWKSAFLLTPTVVYPSHPSPLCSTLLDLFS